MTYSIARLPWLAAAPEDFMVRCRALPGAAATNGIGVGAELQRLATASLTPSQATALARALRRSRDAEADLAPLATMRLGVLSNATFDVVADGLPAAAARHGVALEVVTTPYDQVMQQALDPASGINGASLDAVLIAVDHRWLGLDRAVSAEAVATVLDQAIAELATVVAALRDTSGAASILQTVPAFPQPLFGNYERRVAGSHRAMIDEANRRIVALAGETGSYLLDVAALAEQIGTDSWFDPVQWVAYKLPFSSQAVPCFADLLGRLLGAIRGKARKCLVLDLDNTVWGGVIGDDGLEGIVLGQGSAKGEAFVAVQRLALALRDRGIVLAVSSKNDDAVARGPFRDHAEMLLREDHIAVFQANWSDKATNLEAIATALNIGLDSLVMLDDNPAERAQLRAALPMVAVPELPSDPSWYPWFLASAGYFETVAFSDEDRRRAESYAADAARVGIQARSRDLGDYLTSLDMTLSAEPFDAKGRQRITQLVNKTNQFNLTTRRYSETQIEAFERDAATFTLQVRLADRYGDLGMIGIVVARPLSDDATAWEIDSWLMSCRVLGRRVEEAMLDAVAKAATTAGVTRLIGRYVATAKNGMVADHYAKLGFVPIAAGEFGLDLGGYASPALPFNPGTGSGSS